MRKLQARPNQEQESTITIWKSFYQLLIVDGVLFLMCEVVSYFDVLFPNNVLFEVLVKVRKWQSLKIYPRLYKYKLVQFNGLFLRSTFPKRIIQHENVLQSQILNVVVCQIKMVIFNIRTYTLWNMTEFTICAVYYPLFIRTRAMVRT